MREEILCAVVQSHERELLRFFSSRVGDPSEAQDLVQEVYLRLVKLERPDLIRNPRAYVIRVAANIVREHWLTCAARPPHVEFEENSSDGMPVNEEFCVTLERLELLALVLEDLPPKVAAALIWAYRDGHTYEEIGARLAVSANRVKKYLARAMAHCRKRAELVGIASGKAVKARFCGSSSLDGNVLAGSDGLAS
jgi:RNA polymerase sigma-70 factor (ECF subfamily)